MNARMVCPPHVSRDLFARELSPWAFASITPTNSPGVADDCASGLSPLVCLLCRLSLVLGPCVVRFLSIGPALAFGVRIRHLGGPSGETSFLIGSCVPPFRFPPVFWVFGLARVPLTHLDNVLR